MELSALKTSPKGLIIHHWDTDGLCSAALLHQYFQKLNPELQLISRPPLINNYFLTDLELTQIKIENFAFIIAVDINFTSATIKKLQELTPRFYWFDHHHRDEEITCLGKQDAKYLSCSALLTEYLSSTDQSLSVLGKVGDQEEKVEAHPDVIEICRAQGMNFRDLIHLKDLIDTHYIINDYLGMQQTIQALATAPFSLLQNDLLQKNYKNIKAEENKILQTTPEIKGKCFCFKLDSPYNILSSVTRKLAKKYPEQIILNYQEHNGQSNLYARTARPEIDFRPLISVLRQEGWSAGGKKEVIGIALATAQLSGLLNRIIKEYA